MNPRTRSVLSSDGHSGRMGSTSPPSEILGSRIADQHLLQVVESLARWLEEYGEMSYDHQSFFAGPIGRRLKRLYYDARLIGTAAVAPAIFCEAFVPSARRFFWKKQRFAIADAHWAMGHAFLHEATGEQHYYDRAVHFLRMLKQSATQGKNGLGWGYPFNWETRGGNFRAGTPMITTLPYVYEAFRQVHAIDGDPSWKEIMDSIAAHAAMDYADFEESSSSASCGYSPGDQGGKVVNSSAYRAFLLVQAASDLDRPDYRTTGFRNLRFVLDSQQPDGSWPYAVDSVRGFVDHFHTCFVLKALAKIERLTGDPNTTAAIEKGIAYYVGHLLDERSRPKPFSKAPRLTVYRQELYDCAECINLGVLLGGRFPKLDGAVSATVEDLLKNWLKPDGSFRSRRLLVGWDNVPMHRWGQSQVFRSLAALVEV